MTQIIQEPISERSFSQWSMGYTKTSLNQLRQISSLNDFFEAGNCLADINEGRAKKLLYAFSKGYWRSTVL